MSTSTTEVAQDTMSTSTTEAAQDGDITVGAEWELLYPYLVKNSSNPPWEGFNGPPNLLRVEADESDIDSLLDIVISRVWVALCEAFQNQRDFDFVRFDTSFPDYHNQLLKIWKKNWIVKDDHSVELTNEEEEKSRCRWFGVEIASPIMMCPDGFKAKVRAMTEALGRIDGVRVNRKCAFQLHIGVKGGYSLLTLKKLATILYFSASRLEGLCRTDRRNFRWCKPVANSWMICTSTGRHLRDTVTGTDAEYMEWVAPATSHSPVLPRLQSVLEPVWRASDKRQITSLLFSHPAAAYNFNNLHPESYLRQGLFESSLVKNTVEFRPMGATLDAGVAVAWASLCVRLVDVANTIEVDAFKRLITELQRPAEEYTVWDLVKELKDGVVLKAPEIEALVSFVQAGWTSEADTHNGWDSR